MSQARAVRLAAMSAVVAVVLSLSVSASSAAMRPYTMLASGKSGWSTNSDLVKWGKSGWRQAVMAAKQAALLMVAKRM